MKRLTETHTQGGLTAHESPFKLSQEISTYTELRQQIHQDLRIQHPEWVQPNGESPMCDFYEARLFRARQVLRWIAVCREKHATGRINVRCLTNLRRS